jgi:hypothetical protein
MADTESSPAANHAQARTKRARPGSPPRSGDQPRTSIIVRPKIGSADANKIAKTIAIGRPAESAPEWDQRRRDPDRSGDAVG